MSDLLGSLFLHFHIVQQLQHCRIAHCLLSPPPPLSCASGATSSLARCLYYLVKELSSRHRYSELCVIVSNEKHHILYRTMYSFIIYRHNKSIIYNSNSEYLFNKIQQTES